MLPSALVGPAPYRPLEQALLRRGHEASVAPVRGPTTETVLEGYVAAATDADLVVAHSNAGRFAPAVGATVGADVVVVDGLLPDAEPDPGFEDFVRTHLRPDGLLAPWTQWHSRADLEAVLPSPDWVERIEAEQPRWSLEFLTARVPSPPEWPATSYLFLGHAYDALLPTVERRGLRWRRIDGDHLLVLGDPDLVADEVLALAANG